MPPSNEKMWSTNYMDTYNKRKPARRSYKYRKPLVVPKETAIDTSYLTPRPKTSYEPYRITPDDKQQAINSYFASLSLQDAGVPTSPLPLFLDPSGEYTADGNTLDPSQHYLYGLLNAANTLHAKTEQLQAQKQQQDSDTLAENIRSGGTPVPSPPKEPRSKTPDPRQDYHWICWPEPDHKPSTQDQASYPPRPSTSLGISWPPPRPGNPGDEDRPHSTEPGYPYGDQEESARGHPMTFVPELLSWINAASDYDKAFIYRLMALNGSLPMIPQHMRPRRETTYTFGTNKFPMTTQTYLPNPYAQRWVPGGGNITPRPPMFLPQMQRSNTDMDDLNNARRYLRPNLGKSQEYIHEHSMFMTTQPLCRGHFIIHPDWVSERLPKRKVTPFKKSRASMRYGSVN